MADIEPFPGLRPRPDLVGEVASPPYDVLSSDEARAMAAANRYSFLHVTKAEIDLDPGVDPHSDEVYRKSAQNFRELIAGGVLVRDKTPCFYIYQMTMGAHTQCGLVVGASADEYERGSIKKHEHTRRDKEDDRARHVEILRANAGPVLFTYRARKTIGNMVDKLCQKDKPAFDFVATDSVRHTLWVVSAPDDIERLVEGFRPVDALYIADGHHRTASAFRVRDILRATNPHHSGDEAYNYFLAVLYPGDELMIMGYHRVVRDLDGLAPEAFLEKVARKFEILPSSRPTPAGPRQFGMHLDNRWYRLTALQGTFPADDLVLGLDVSILQENLLAPILGISDPRTDERIDFVGGIRGTGELERRCSRDMRVAFACHPVSVTQMMVIADSGAVMPPKSTWFGPKLRSGLVVRSLDDSP